MWDSLLLNIALIALVLVVWQTLAETIDLSKGRAEGAVIGTLLGLAGCVSVMTATEFLPGILIDLRTATVVSAAFFGGPVAALIAGGLTGAMRASMGGAGVAAALASIAASAAVGLVVRRHMGDGAVGPRGIALLSLGASASYGAAYLLIPADKLPEVFAATFWPMFALNFATTFCFASLSARELRRQELIAKNAIYRQMVECLPDPLVAKDADGRIVAANPAAAAFAGAPGPDALLGRRAHDGLPGELARQARADEEAVLRTGRMSSVERRIAGGDGPDRWMWTKMVALLDRSGRPFGLVVHSRDVTQQHRLLEMKSEFVSLVSHELRTPLTSVRGSLGLLSGTLPAATPQAARKLLGIAQRNSERLVRLINDILDVEKIENGSLEFRLAPCAVAPLIEDMLPGFEKYMPDQAVALRLVDHAPGAVARIDAGRFEQVLSNLVSNAIKFSAHGGTVTIHLTRGEAGLTVSVRDQGSGIPESFRARVFERFEQSDASDARARGGTGLGLHIAKVFVEKMGGRISFQSREGEGTTFHLVLPEAEGAAVPAGQDPPPAAPAPRDAAHRLLYIEDDASLGSVLSGLLAGEVDVDHVTGLEAARRALATARYDLLLIDDDLPDGSGMSLLEARGDLPPCIVFTAREVRCPPGAPVLARFVKTRVEESEVVDAIRAALRRKAA